MELLLLIGLLALIIYACRLSGFIMRSGQIWLRWRPFLQLVPVAVFSALAVSPLIHAPDHIGPKLAVLILAGGVYLRTHRFDAAILVGMASLWLFIALTAG